MSEDPSVEMAIREALKRAKEPVALGLNKPSLKPAGSLHPFSRINKLIAEYNAAAARLELADHKASHASHEDDMVAIHKEQVDAKEALAGASTALADYESRSASKRPRPFARSCMSRTLADRSKYTHPWYEDRKHGFLPRRERDRRALLATGIKVNQSERDDEEAVV